MRHKDYTREEALARLSELKTELEGKGSSLPVNFCRRYDLEVPQWARDCWAKRMREYRQSDKSIGAKARMRRLGRRDPVKAAEYRREWYENNKEICFARAYSRNYLASRNLLRDGWEIHHFNGADWKTFIYLPGEAHRLLHSTFGAKNEDVGLKQFYESAVNLIPEYLLIVNKTVMDSAGFTEEEIKRCQE